MWNSFSFWTSVLLGLNAFTALISVIIFVMVDRLNSSGTTTGRRLSRSLPRALTPRQRPKGRDPLAKRVGEEPKAPEQEPLTSRVFPPPSGS